MIIALILSAFMLATLALGLVMRRRSPPLGIALVLIALAGTWFAWQPDALTVVARRLGVGRGTDLLVYLWLPVSMLVLAGIAVQLRYLQRQLTLLAREVALERARRDHNAWEANPTGNLRETAPAGSVSGTVGRS